MCKLLEIRVRSRVYHQKHIPCKLISAGKKKVLQKRLPMLLSNVVSLRLLERLPFENRYLVATHEVFSHLEEQSFRVKICKRKQVMKPYKSETNTEETARLAIHFIEFFVFVPQSRRLLSFHYWPELIENVQQSDYYSRLVSPCNGFGRR